MRVCVWVRARSSCDCDRPAARAQPVSIACLYRDLGCVLLGPGGKAVGGAAGQSAVATQVAMSIGEDYFLVCASDG